MEFRGLCSLHAFTRDDFFPSDVWHLAKFSVACRSPSFRQGARVVDMATVGARTMRTLTAEVIALGTRAVGSCLLHACGRPVRRYVRRGCNGEMSRVFFPAWDGWESEAGSVS